MNYRLSLLAAVAGISLNAVSVDAASASVTSVVKPVVYDDGNGGCIKLPGFLRKPSLGKPKYGVMGGLEQGAGLISQAVADGDNGAVAKNLESFFAGAPSRGGQEQTAVAAGGSWNFSGGFERGFAAGDVRKRLDKRHPVPQPRIEEEQSPIVLVGAVDTAVGAIGGYIIEKGIEKADKALNDYVNRDQTKESIDKYGGCRMKGTC